MSHAKLENEAATAGKGLPAWLVATALFCFFPLGFFLLAKHPTLSTKRAWWVAGSAWAAFVLMSAFRKETGESVTPEQSSVAVDSKPLVDNDEFTSWPKVSTGRRSPVDMTKAFNLRTGMSEGQVRSILGEPHEAQRMIIKSTPFSGRRETYTWSYKGDHPDDFILVGIENGQVSHGGSQGWDFEKGFGGSASEKKRIIEHYMQFLKNGGTPPFDNLNPPAPGGT